MYKPCFGIYFDEMDDFCYYDCPCSYDCEEEYYDTYFDTYFDDGYNYDYDDYDYGRYQLIQKYEYNELSKIINDVFDSKGE